MLVLSIQAPFAVCRTFTAGWFRPTATFLTPSAAYGLLLNLAGIETRLREEDDGHPGTIPATVTKTGLPVVKLALGLPESAKFPLMTTMYQQLHNYPVGSSGNERSTTTFGNKYNITPVRRELLCNVHALIVVDGDEPFEQAVRVGLSGQRIATRYGLPFLGDNSFLPDRIEPLDAIPAAFWYERVSAEAKELHSRTTRLTIWIDRADMSRTQSALFAPTESANREIPFAAWTTVAPS